MDDAHSRMLDIAIGLAAKAEAGVALTPTEITLSDIAWIDTQVAPTGSTAGSTTPHVSA